MKHDTVTEQQSICCVYMNALMGQVCYLKENLKKNQNQKYAKFSSFLNQAGREEEKNHAVWEEMRCQNLKGKNRTFEIFRTSSFLTVPSLLVDYLMQEARFSFRFTPSTHYFYMHLMQHPLKEVIHKGALLSRKDLLCSEGESDCNSRCITEQGINAGILQALCGMGMMCFV